MHNHDIDTIILRIKAEQPQVQCKQLEVVHPDTDDDGLWFFWLAGENGEVQIESSTGNCPFLIETDKHNRRQYGHTIPETVDIVLEWLKLDTPPLSPE